MSPQHARCPRSSGRPRDFVWGMSWRFHRWAKAFPGHATGPATGRKRRFRQSFRDGRRLWIHLFAGSWIARNRWIRAAFSGGRGRVRKSGRFLCAPHGDLTHVFSVPAFLARILLLVHRGVILVALESRRWHRLTRGLDGSSRQVVKVRAGNRCIRPGGYGSAKRLARSKRG